MKFKRIWSSQSVRECCIKCNWYTCGVGSDYDAMLIFVEGHKPTDRNIEKVAMDIHKHSEKEEGRTLTLVADVLAHESVRLILEEE